MATSLTEMKEIKIELLTSHPHLVPTIAAWHRAEWGHLYTEDVWSDAQAEIELEATCDPESQGQTWLALDSYTHSSIAVLGSVCLFETCDDIVGFEHLTPWLDNMFVMHAARGRGVGTALINALMAAARIAGHEVVYLFCTACKLEFWAKMGWSVAAAGNIRTAEPSEGAPVIVMVRFTYPCSACQTVCSRQCSDIDHEGSISQMCLGDGGAPEEVLYVNSGPAIVVHMNHRIHSEGAPSHMRLGNGGAPEEALDVKRGPSPAVRMNRQISYVSRREHLTQMNRQISYVSRREHLTEVPGEYLSGDAIRPLVSRDKAGNEFTHVLRPTFSVMCIVMMEVMDELSYYGIVGTFVLYLEGMYPAHFWSAGMTTIQGGQLVSTSIAIMFTTPFIMAIIADSFIGNYLTILICSLCLYLPGLLLIALTAYPNLLGNTFPTGVLTTAMLGIIPLGSGAIKACVNVLGAQQFHPVLQRRQMERYFVNFYLTVNIGALIGGMIIPIVLRYSAFAGYMLSTCCFFLAIIVFVMGNYRHNYIKMHPQGKDNLTVLAILGKVICSLQSLERQKVSCGGRYSDELVQSIKRLGAVIPVIMLIMPFNIVFGQIISMFVVQGAVMADAGFVDAAWMQNFNPIAIIVLGAFISGKLYPYLEKSNKELDISSKFMIGTIFGALAMLWAILVDFMIISKYAKTSQAISILWQAPSFFLIGAGEIFAISSAYEAAFIIAPRNLKALASSTNLFLIGGLPKFISIALVAACSDFFTNADGNQDIMTLSSYATAHVWKYFLVLLGIALLGVLINALPVMRRFLKRTLDSAEEDIEMHNNE